MKHTITETPGKVSTLPPPVGAFLAGNTGGEHYMVTQDGYVILESGLHISRTKVNWTRCTPVPAGTTLNIKVAS